ncbi:MAG: DNA-binding response regulator, partial [Bacteroidetes bacterium]
AFDTLTKLTPANFEVIFVTAFNEYAIRAFKFSAIDYLLKPVDIDELRMAVEKAIKRIKEKNLNSRLDILLQDNIAPGGPKKIALPTIDGLAFYEVSEIISCIAEGPYTKFAFTRDRNLLVTGALKEFEELLPEGTFCRIHHSCLINLNHIKKYYKGRGGMVEMSNGDQFEVSARKRDEFLSKFRL